MVEPDSAEPILETPRSVSRSGGVPGVVKLGDDVGGEGRIIERAPVEPLVAAAERSGRSRRATRGSVNFTATGWGRIRVKEMNATDAADMSAALWRLGFELTTELDADRVEQSLAERGDGGAMGGGDVSEDGETLSTHHLGMSISGC